MSHLRPKEQELELARRRNQARIKREERPLRCFALRRFEGETINLTGSVTVERPIWPPSSRKYAFCTWIRPGETVIALEDVKAWGKDPRNAIYVYRDQKEWDELDEKAWVYIMAKNAPIRSSRFHMICQSTERIINRFRWRIVLEKAPNPMR